MRTRVKSTARAALVTASFAALGIGTFFPIGAYADTTSGDFSVLGGNQVNIPVSVPVNVCGNAVAVLGAADAGCKGGATVRQGGGDGYGGGRLTSGHHSVAGGNQVGIPVAAPVNACGNAVAVLGTADAGCKGGATVRQGGGDGYGGGRLTSGHHSVGGGNQVAVPVSLPINICGNAIGNATASCLGGATTHSGGSVAGGSTSGHHSVGGGNQIAVPVKAPVNVCGNAAAVLGDATAGCVGGSSTGGHEGYTRHECHGGHNGSGYRTYQTAAASQPINSGLPVDPAALPNVPGQLPALSQLPVQVPQGLPQSPAHIGRVGMQPPANARTAGASPISDLPVTPPVSLLNALPVTPPAGLPVTTPAGLPSSLPVAPPAGLPGGLPVAPPAGLLGGLPVNPAAGLPGGLPVAPPAGLPGGLPVNPPADLPVGLPVASTTSLPGGLPVAPPAGLPEALPIAPKLASTLPVASPAGLPVSLPMASATNLPAGLPGGLPVTPPAGLPGAPQLPGALPVTPKLPAQLPQLPGGAVRTVMATAGTARSTAAQIAPVTPRDLSEVPAVPQLSAPRVSDVTDQIDAVPDGVTGLAPMAKSQLLTSGVTPGSVYVLVVGALLAATAAAMAFTRRIRFGHR
jgi:hypothetical protein